HAAPAPVAPALVACSPAFALALFAAGAEDSADFRASNPLVPGASKAVPARAARETASSASWCTSENGPRADAGVGVLRSAVEAVPDCGALAARLASAEFVPDRLPLNPAAIPTTAAIAAAS